jgi:hypothetical protein
MKVEHRPVGKINFVIEKENKPTRWRTIYKENTPKPAMMMMNIAKQEKELYNLREHKLDDIDDFEGNQIWDEKKEVDREDLTWLFPEKGPGPFKQKKKKKQKGRGRQ